MEPEAPGPAGHLLGGPAGLPAAHCRQLSSNRETSLGPLLCSLLRPSVPRSMEHGNLAAGTGWQAPPSSRPTQGDGHVSPEEHSSLPNLINPTSSHWNWKTKVTGQTVGPWCPVWGRGGGAPSWPCPLARCSSAHTLGFFLANPALGGIPKGSGCQHPGSLSWLTDLDCHRRGGVLCLCCSVP